MGNIRCHKWFCVTTLSLHRQKGNAVEKHLGARVVKTLTETYVNTFRHIYFDNFFTSLGLLIDLYKSGLYGCGTMRSDRKGFPQQLKSVAKRGFSIGT